MNPSTAIIRLKTQILVAPFAMLGGDKLSSNAHEPFIFPTSSSQVQSRNSSAKQYNVILFGSTARVSGTKLLRCDADNRLLDAARSTSPERLLLMLSIGSLKSSLGAILFRFKYSFCCTFPRPNLTFYLYKA